jgi:hypothetical protein
MHKTAGYYMSSPPEGPPKTRTQIWPESMSTDIVVSEAISVHYGMSFPVPGLTYVRRHFRQCGSYHL